MSTKTAEKTVAKISAKLPAKVRAAQRHASNGGAVLPAGPNKPQLRILAALAKLKEGQTLPRAAISERASVNLNEVIELLGGTDAPVSDLVRGRGPVKLVPAKLARTLIVDIDGHGERHWAITAAGRRALERAAAQAGASPAARASASAKPVGSNGHASKK